MGQILPISEVKTRLPALVTGVAEREEEIVVTRKGKPVAVLVNYADWLPQARAAPTRVGE
jgi:prevent-host-death family protein